MHILTNIYIFFLCCPVFFIVALSSLWNGSSETTTMKIWHHWQTLRRSAIMCHVPFICHMQKRCQAVVEYKYINILSRVFPFCFSPFKCLLFNELKYSKISLSAYMNFNVSTRDLTYFFLFNTPRFTQEGKHTFLGYFALFEDGVHRKFNMVAGCV